MVKYDPKDWITFIFRFHKADTFRKLIPMMIFIAIYSGSICFLETTLWKLSSDSHIKNIPIMHGMLGFVISLLLAYRTNTAYDRWWEGRKSWGALVNNSRSMAIKTAVILNESEDRKFFQNMIPTYASGLQKHLCDDNSSYVLYDEDVSDQLNHDKHKPNQIAKIIFQKINEIYLAEKISKEQFLILNAEFTTMIEVCGACERIKNTPIPYSYSAFIKKFIFFYIMTLPFGYVFNLGYYVIPVVVFIFFVLASLELIAEEIEDPFGYDENDLPTAKIASNIEKHVAEIFE